MLYFLDEDNMCNAEDDLWEETEPKEIWRYEAESFGGTEKQVSKQPALEQSPMLNNSFICFTDPGDVIMQ